MPKFYFFDVGVARMLQNSPVPGENQAEFGSYFEQYMFMELRAYLDYIQSRELLAYWRTTSGFEVDFIIGDQVAIETKTKKKADAKDFKGLKAFKEEGLNHRLILVCREDRPRKVEKGIEIMPWTYFLDQLWSGAIIAG